MTNFQAKANFIWAVADPRRGDYKRSEFGKVIMPLTVLRLLDCVLETTKAKVLERAKTLPISADDPIKGVMHGRMAGQSFYNLSRFCFQKPDAVTGKGYISHPGDQEQIAANLKSYLKAECHPIGLNDV